MSVGKSWRTHAKHELMSSFLGKEVGAARHLSSVKRLIWLDLTAGDGLAVDGQQWLRGCSPGILSGHAFHSGKPVEIWLHEIQSATYDRLLASLRENLPKLAFDKVTDEHWRLGNRVHLRTVNGSGHLASVELVGRSDAVVVLNDPNAITEWAMRESFAQEIADRAWCFRSLSTMGCNPSGLKRLDITERRGWFDLIGRQERALPPHRDLLLAAIERDESQWAYLLGDPGKWRPQTESVVKTAFGKVGRTVALTWFRQDPERFEETKRTLFLTKKERQEMGL